MRPLLRAAVFVAMVLGSSVAVTGESSARVCLGCPPSQAGSVHSAEGYVLTVSALSRINHSAGGSDAGHGPRYLYSFAPSCPGNDPSDGDALCGHALQACRAKDRTALMYLIFRGLSVATMTTVGQACLGDADFVDRAQLSHDVVAELMRRLQLAAPVVHTAPPRVTLVRLPTVVWSVNPRTGAPDERSYSVSATVDDVSVTLRVDGRWRWNLADGSGAGASGPGVAFVAGRTPDPRTAPGYYTGGGAGAVTTFPTRGTRQLGVTVSWVPSYTVVYEVGVTRLDDAAVTYTSTAPLRVGEARAVLVAGNDGDR